MRGVSLVQSSPGGGDLQLARIYRTNVGEYVQEEPNQTGGGQHQDHLRLVHIRSNSLIGVQLRSGAPSVHADSPHQVHHFRGTGRGELQADGATDTEAPRRGSQLQGVVSKSLCPFKFWICDWRGIELPRIRSY
ncbi:hypothetical protein OJ253_1954 [Cryptosporidium canis]|uniref:Uncharacterized protein n=1 Tax=Cryptosporidium canis TaxID=195482 RepID=A0A9D5DJ29_9CRYT|nr:hypothetical protein OJ253_1954 [Cryptosporidium canis]